MISWRQRSLPSLGRQGLAIGPPDSVSITWEDFPMPDPLYISEVSVMRVKGPLRRAELPARKDPIWFGVHGGAAKHYGVSAQESDPTTTTLDYLLAAAVGSLTGTLGSALEERQIPAGDGRLSAEGRGEIGLDEGVLVVRRIEVRYTLRLREDDVETAMRVHDAHADRCPVARTLAGCVEILTELHTEVV